MVGKVVDKAPYALSFSIQLKSLMISTKCIIIRLFLCEHKQKKLQAKGLKLISINGAGNENRTRDTQLGKLMFYR